MNNRNDRQQSIDWAREALKDPKLVILDTETTGLGPQDEVVQIGILSGTGGVLPDALIKPSRPIPAEATKIHGIGDKDVELASDFRHIYFLMCKRTPGLTLGPKRKPGTTQKTTGHDLAASPDPVS